MTKEYYIELAYKELCASNYTKAIEYYTKAISIDPNDAEAYINRGVAYTNLRKYEEAISDYTKAISIDPNDANAYCNRGNVFYLKGDCFNAKKDWEKAIELYPSYESKLRPYINKCK